MLPGRRVVVVVSTPTRRHCNNLESLKSFRNIHIVDHNMVQEVSGVGWRQNNTIPEDDAAFGEYKLLSVSGRCLLDLNCDQ